MPALVERDGCASCPDLAPCPICPQSQVCQLQVPATCQECPTNVCVAIPGEHGAKTSYMGGAIGGILGALALAAVILWAWRKRAQRIKHAAESARADAKQRTASAEKFKVGGSKGPAGFSDSGGDRKSSGPGGLARKVSSKMVDSNNINNEKSIDEDDEDEDSEDVEWTELREDGLTTFRKPPGARGGDEGDDDGEARPRKSIGAATHLSRITEGAEDDEDDERLRGALRRSAHRNTIYEESERSTIQGQSSSQSSAGSLMQPLGLNEVGMAHVNPFIDGTETHSAQSMMSSSSIGYQHDMSIPSSVAERASRSTSGDNWQPAGRWSATLPDAPSSVHRPTGAPLIDLHGKPRSSHAGHAKAISPLPHSHNMTLPSRPLRDAGLNLRLEDGIEPGVVGRDMKCQRGPFADTSSDQERYISSDQPTQETDEARDLPSELATSNVYSKHAARKSGISHRASVITAATTSSAGTLDYVMSAPRIIASDGPKRVQVHPGGKAQLVHDLSGIRRDKDVAASAFSGHESVGNPFEDDEHDGEARSIQGRVSPSGTFGADRMRPDSDMSFGNVLDGQASRFLGSVDISSANNRLQGPGQRASNLSGTSLPFVDERPIGEPDRSPTDANPRDSISVRSTASCRPSRRPELAEQRSSSASSLPGHRRSAGSGLQPPDVNRQSGTSIGGLSVFDDIPFHIGSPGSPASQNASSSNSRAYADPDLPADAQARIEEEKRRLEQQGHSQQQEQAQSSQQGDTQLQAPRTDLLPSFDEIRLRHELENYPFDLKTQ